MPSNIPTAQPGGGVCFRVELLWGRLRRWYLHRFRSRYVRRMARLRRGDCVGAPWEIVDPRDLKYCSNRCNCFWAAVDDPFAWRDRLPLARWGLAELQLMGWPLAVAAVSLFWSYWYLAWVPLVLLGFLLYFFRDPPRRIPSDPGLLLSPADGRITEITRLDHDEHIGGSAVRIGIFLSLFDVHVNRSPCESRVVALRYSPGEFLNAINPCSARRNESMWIALEEESPPYRRMVVRQIAGAYARRIVCTLKTGESIGRGQKIGMIKLGSRTELIVPDEPQLRIEANVGDRVRGGASIIARY
ncbi:MAG: phosphatidylserine decarboxylase family protein [Rhodopirellula sp.]|nr:phosphatidylserine decarboxylase family protein [Rhodopirellula sp.]